MTTATVTGLGFAVLCGYAVIALVAENIGHVK